MISKANKNRGNIKVLQIDPTTQQVIREFLSVNIASQETGICPQNISRSCHHTRFKAGGFVWRCKNKDFLPFDFNSRLPQNCKIVLQINISTNTVINEFESISEASRQTKICSSNISRVCSGRAKTTGGFKWRYKNTHEA